MLIWARRHGKDKTIFNWCITELLKSVPQTCYYCLPEFSHGRRVIWDNIDNSGLPLLSHIPKDCIKTMSKQEMKIEFVNGSIFQIVGADSYDKLVGANPKIVVFSEYGITNPRAWDYLRPILDSPENNGVAIFVGTPRGKNHFFDLYRMAKANPDRWYSETITNADTKLLSDSDISRLKREGMSEEMVLQEFYCSWEMGMEGSYYSRYLGAVDREDRKGHLPLDLSYKVHTAWDIGLDATSVVFFQLVGNEIRIIDHYEDSNTSIQKVFSEILSRKYIYGKHFAPHDGNNRNVMTGISCVDVARQMGLDMDVIPNDASIMDGIELVKGMFPRFWFDGDKCEYLLKCLLNYHAEYDEGLKKYRDKPLHDYSSHASDATRYMALAIHNGMITTEHRSEWGSIKDKMGYHAHNNPGKPLASS